MNPKPMVHIKAFTVILCMAAGIACAQVERNPIIKTAGGIYEIPMATVKPDPNLEYNIVVDVLTGPDKPDQINPSLDNVARLMNLHAVGGVPMEKLHIVLAVHNVSAFSLMKEEAYQKKFKTSNPNLKLLEELHQAGVKIAVCGQSLIKRSIETSDLVAGVEVATSMLTTVTTYQLKGYAALKF